jgi:hypothetical protein
MATVTRTTHGPVDLEADGRSIDETIRTRRFAFRTRFALGITGTVVEARTKYPLVGLVVVVRAGGQSKQPVALTPTDEAGFFRFGPPALTSQQLSNVALGTESLAFEVRRSRRERAYLVSPLLHGSAALHPALQVELPHRRVTNALWRMIGKRMETSRLVELHAVARELLRPVGRGLFGDLDLETRHELLIELEKGFLDPAGTLGAHQPLPTFAALRAPGGLESYRRAVSSSSSARATRAALDELTAKVTAFASLLEIGWVTDPMELKSAKVGPGTTKFQDAYATPAITAVVSKPTDLSRYRDYLLAIWTGGPHAETAAENLGQLGTRFHQSFTTLDVTPRRANDVLAPILKKILGAPVGSGYGFGIAAAQIEPKGQRTSREYLDYLISLTKLSSRELGLRYRLDLERPDSALSSPVEENIHTLQRFYGDGFEEGSDPFLIFPARLVGRSPFFLFYEEWLERQKPFYAENVYPLGSTFSSGIASAGRAEVKGSSTPGAAWLELLVRLEDALAAAREHLEEGELAEAADDLDSAEKLAWEAIELSYDDDGLGEQVQSDQTVIELGAKTLPLGDVKAHAASIENATIDSPAALQAFIGLYEVGNDRYETPGTLDHPKLWEWLNGNRIRLWFGLLHTYAYVIPAYRGDLARAKGDYQEAVEHYRAGTQFFLANADAGSKEGYPSNSKVSLPEAVQDPSLVEQWESSLDDTYPPGDLLYRDGGLPYTVDLSKTQYPQRDYVLPGDERSNLARTLNPMEVRFFRLRQAEVMLEWADALYRSDEPSSIQRARELYKDVLWLHRSTPPIKPNWNGKVALYFGSQNPAVISQTTRARVALGQIEAGMNVYGVSDQFVPALRFRPLKDTADRMAAAAKGAQQDFLAAMSKIEDAQRETLLNNNMLRKAKLLAQIAGEQAQIAAFGVTLAEQQVQQVQAAIDAKQAEIDDHDDLFTQFGEVIGGMVGIIGGIAGAGTKAGGAVGVSGAEAGSAVSAGAGFSYAEAGSLTAAAGGGAILGGYGIFMYAGLTSLSNVNDAQESRKAELDRLRDVALPLAQAQVEAKQREVTIAQLQAQVAQADAELAEALLKFQATRFLNTKLWTEIANVMRRVLRRYLALGARFGWLAERALAYEQDRALDLIRLDYYPEKLQGVTGADLLQLDLAELDAARLEGMRQLLPIERTYSLAFDFPFAFAKLQNTGRCSFATSEAPLQLAHPGTYGYRVRAVTMTPKSYAGTPPPAGLLTNLGISLLSRANGEMHASLRGADAAAVSEFELASDMGVFGLPGETLLAFEGSGIDTIWGLEFGPAANPTGLDALADVEIKFDLQASWSPQLRAQHLAAAPTSVRRFVLVSGLKQDMSGMAALVADDVPTAEIVFDLAAAGLPTQESGRTVTNLAVLVAGAPLDLTASLRSDTLPPVVVQVESGFAVSNSPPLSDAESSFSPSPLNALTGQPVDQTFTVAIDKNANSTVEFEQVVDVILGVEYEAELPVA